MVVKFISHFLYLWVFLVAVYKTTSLEFASVGENTAFSLPYLVTSATADTKTTFGFVTERKDASWFWLNIQDGGAKNKQHESRQWHIDNEHINSFKQPGSGLNSDRFRMNTNPRDQIPNSGEILVDSTRISEKFRLSSNNSTAIATRAAIFKFANPGTDNGVGTTPTSIGRRKNPGVHPSLQQHILGGLAEIIRDFTELQSVVSNEGPALNRVISVHASTRIVRSSFPPTNQRRVCTITADQLRDLDSNTNGIDGYSSRASTDVTCDIEKSNATNCDKWIVKIKCGILHLESGFQKAIRGSISLDELVLWKSKYNTLKASWDKASIEIRDSVSQEYQLNVDSLELKLEDMQEQINNLEHQLNAGRAHYKQTLIELCASGIRQGEFQLAVDTFLESLDDASLDVIVRKAYAGNSTNIPKVIRFFETFSCYQRSIAYPALYAEMKSRSHSQNPHILTLWNAMQQCDLRWFSVNLTSTVLNSKTTLMKHWGAKIRNKDYGEVTAYDETYNSDFIVHLDEIIQEAFFKKIQNSGNVLSFIDNLLYPRDRVLGYRSLFDAMIGSNCSDGHELVTLVFRSKQLMDGNMVAASLLEQERLSEIKTIIPAAFSALLWNSSVEIENKKHDNYFATGVTECYAVGLRMLKFSSEQYACESIGDRFWKVIPIDSGRYFGFLNEGSGTLYGVEKWEVLSVEQGAYFRLKPFEDPEFLSVESPGWWYRRFSRIRSECEMLVKRNDSQDSSLWSII